MAVVSSGQSFVLFAIFALIIQTSVQPSLSRPCSGIHDLGVHDDYALMSTYDANLNNALSLIFSNTGGSMGSYASSSGQDPYKIYVVGVCRGDLKRDDCRTCLHEARAALTTTCTKKDGAIQWNDRCSLRFSTSAISPADMLWHDSHSLSGVTASSPPKGKEKTRTAIIVVAPVVTLMLLVVSICIILRRQPKVHFQNTNKITNVESFQFDFGIIKAATNNFSDVNELGKGGFGTVYRGKLSNGQEIAVKRLSSNSTQGDGEFRNEVLLVAKLQHRNLVKLLGFCLEKSERLLVYEFVPNASLDHYIFDPLKSKSLDWEKRYKIICGIARGMLYLHEDSRFRIIHRDVKAANILLDATMNPKISDFGMARMFVMDQTQGNTNRIVGTFGYMAPEYAMFGEFSTKSDVFSFGVLILEILSGHKITSFCNNDKTEHLLSLAWRSWKHETASNLIDPTLIKGGPIAEIMRCIHIGLLCVQQTVVDRPNMASVVLMLNSSAMALPVPTEPACFLPSKIQLATSPQSNINCWGSTYGLSITELFPR